MFYYSNMRRPFKVVIFLLSMLTIMHFYKFKKYNSKYEIQQQELDYIDGNELYDQLNPLIITFIEDTSLMNNINKYQLYSAMSFNKKNFMYNTNKNYLSHSNEFILIRTKKQVVVELINPKYRSRFVKNNKQDKSIFYQFNLNENNYKNVKSIDIVMREYNILVIPRQWLFKIDNSTVEVYTADNIFSYLFGIF
jgi:hypothetical protein